MKRPFLTLALVVLLPRLTAAQESIEYYGQDALGSIRIVFAPNGTAVGRQDYAPFGRPLLPVPAMPRESFGAQEKDDETDQSYFHARMFQARTGRFSRPDPIQSGRAEPQGLNRYAYALNNPVTFRDTNGLFPLPINPCLVVGCEAGPGSGSGPGSGGIPGDVYGGDERNPQPTDPPDGSGGSTDTPSPPPVDEPDDPQKPPLVVDGPTTCKAVPFDVTGIGPRQAPNNTALTFTPRAKIPDGGVAIKPANFGVTTVDSTNRNVLAGIVLYADWGTAKKPNRRAPAVPAGLPSTGPYSPVDVIGPRSVREAPGNQIDVYNYRSQTQAFASSRTLMITAVIPKNTVGVTCPQ